MSDFVIRDNVLVEYTGKGGDVAIPEGVTNIDEHAFAWCHSLTSITIPDSVRSIGHSAFYFCSGLTSIAIPEGVTRIEYETFEGCSSLTSVTIPDSVTSIEENAFYKCKSLKNITIPKRVTSIEMTAFYECKSLTSITIPDSVTSIGSYAFKGCGKLKNITIPDSVTSIGDCAFSKCLGLADTSGLVIVRNKVYACKANATNITIPEGVTSIEDEAFKGCKNLTSITIPEGVTSIGSEAFKGCKNLSSVTIPDMVTSIGWGAFDNCCNLTNVTIPNTVTSIGEKVFQGCTNLKRIQINTNLKLSKEMLGNCSVTEIYIHDLGQLPNNLKPAAAICFVNEPDDPKSERGKTHIKYIKANAAKLLVPAFEHINLLTLMCENKLLTPELTETYLTYAQEQQNTEAIAMLLDYQQNKLTSKEKQKSTAKAEAREEKVTDFIFSADAIERLTGKTFVVTGKLNTMTRAEFKACLDACGAVLSETLNDQTDYLITNTPDSGSAKNKKAEQLGVKKITEEEFNQMIGKA